MKLQKVGIPDVQPEEQFIINCLRSEFSGGHNHSLARAGRPGIRWGAVFETALDWNIAPMLYRLIKDWPDLLNASDIPDDVFKSLEAAYVKTYMVNQTNFSELAHIVKTLTEAGIQVLLLKGAHLAQFVYQDIGVRWMADIDILVKRNDLEQANGLLQKMGYQHPHLPTAVWDDFGKMKEVRDSAAVLDWYRTHHMHLTYCNPQAIQNLEVHWGIARSDSPFAVDTEGLWERAWAEKLNGQTVWVLSPEDLLLHVSLHDSYYHHLNLFGLRPCCDVAAVLHRFSEEIDWGHLHIRAREWGIEKYLCLVLRLSREFFGVAAPAEIFEISGDKTFNNRILGQSVRRILGRDTHKPPFRGMKYPSEIHVFNPDEGLFQRIGFFLKRIPISREELASRYSLPASSRQIWLCYFVRLASLFFSYTRVYVPYLWFRLKHGPNHRTDYTLDLWLASPASKK